MTWNDFRASVITRANLAAGYAATKAPTDPDKTDKVLAAAALVISERGPNWCLENPKRFADLTKANLGTWLNLALTLASIFVPGGSVWLTLLQTLLPAVLELLEVRSKAVGRSSPELTNEFDALKTDATKILKGTR